jgi:DNA polymerase-3 subunit alpha
VSNLQFVHLHNHTEYSLLDGMVRVKDLVSKAKELGMNSVAMTDHGNMFGAIEFYKACKAADIKPIIGSEFYLTSSSRFEKKDKTRYHLVLLARNQVGYKNLIKLSSLSNLEGYYYKPRVDYDLLQQYSEGLICMTACLQGEIPQLILQDKLAEAEEKSGMMREIFGRENFFYEIQMHGIPEQKTVARELYRLSKKMQIPLVATNDVHYCNKEDYEAHEVLLCIGTKKRLSDSSRIGFSRNEFYFKSEQEMLQVFGEIPKALSNTQFIAQMCELDIQLPGPILPQFDIPEHFTTESYLRKISYDGLVERYDEVTPELQERLDMELGVIERMGFPGYFLIVWDFIRYARQNGIWVGPGRGSGAGSIVAYSLGITNVDPLPYGLLFERFLNEERVSMPDFDIDFCKERRGEVIDYVCNKYTQEKVSQIVTFSKLKARAVLRNVARVLDIPLTRVDYIAKLVPKTAKNLNEAIESEAELKQIYQSGTPQERQLLDISFRLENLSRHTGVHAAGVVIGREAVTDYVPVQVVKDEKNGDMITTQFDGPLLEECGLVKMDFLGLITLTLLRDCLALLEQRGIVIDLDKIPLDDPEVFRLFSRGETDAIFQFESAGMQKYLKKLKPTQFEDLIAMNALYRPGPMDYIDTYIARKHGEEEVEYDHPLMEPILKETNGIMIYQEQVMQIAQVIAGYTLGSADILRRAMGKKKHKVMAEHEQLFINGGSIYNEVLGKDLVITGAVNQDITEETARTIFNKMAEFANYGFNKSHATAYAYLAYQSAYLKAHYPVEFMASVLTSEIGSPDKLQLYVQSIKRLGITLLPPDVSSSQPVFSVEDGSIRYALCGIKGVGEKAAHNIAEVREKTGSFRNLAHFLEEVDLSVVNKAVCEILIKSGAMDTLGHKRRWMLESLDDITQDAQRHQAEKRVGQGNLFAEIFESQPIEQHDTGEDTVEWDEITRLGFEKEILGFYLTGHPLTPYKRFIRSHTSQTTQSINTIQFKTPQAGYAGIGVTMAGIIEEVRVITNANGEQWAIVRFEDFEGSAEMYVYKNLFKEVAEKLGNNAFIYIKGRVKMKQNDQKMVVAESIEDLGTLKQQSLSEFHVYLKDAEAKSEDLARFKQDLSQGQGTLSLFFHVPVNEDRESVIKATNAKAPCDTSLCDQLANRYTFIDRINIC